MAEIQIPQLAHEFLERALFTSGWTAVGKGARYSRWHFRDGAYVLIVPNDPQAGDYEALIEEAEATRQFVKNLARAGRPLLHDTADIEVLPPETVFRTADGSVGQIYDTTIVHIVQWIGTDLFDELPRGYAYPFPDMFFPAEVIWSPDER